MFKNKGLYLQKCVTYVLDLCLKYIIGIRYNLGDLLSQQFGTDCTCALDSLSQLNVLHCLHADMLIGCLTVLVCGMHAGFVFYGKVCLPILLQEHFYWAASFRNYYFFRKLFYSIKWYHHPLLKWIFIY